jgi:hypothetical protein
MIMLEDQVIQTGAADIFDAMIPIMANTSISFDFDKVRWSTVNTCQRPADWIETKLEKTSKCRNPSSANSLIQLTRSP